MPRDGSLSTYPVSLDQLAIKWPIGNDRINGQASSTRNDLERAVHWNHMFDACLNLEKYMQKVSAGGGIITYTATGGVLQGQNIILTYESRTLPASGSQTEWTYTLTTPDIFGDTPFNDWRFNISPCIYVDVLPAQYLRPVRGLQGAFSDYDYRPELLSVYQPHVLVEPVSGRVFKLKVKTHQMHSRSQLIGELLETGQRPTTTDQLGASWLRSGSYPAMGIGNTSFTVGAPGNLFYLSSEGEYGNPNSNTWQENWGLAFPSTMGTSQDQQVIFSPYTWKGDGVDTGDYMQRACLVLRFSGDWGNTAGNLNFYAVVIGDETMGALNRPTTGRLMKFVNNYMFDINVYDSFALTAAVANSSASSLGTFPLKLSLNHNLPNLRYRFRAQGTTLTVDEAEDGQNYTNLLSVTDSSHSSGTVGVLSLPMRGTGSGEKCRRLMYFNYLNFQVLSGESPCNMRANLLYSLVGPPNPTTQTL